VDKKEKTPSPFAQPMETPVKSSDMQELYRRLKPEMRRAKPGPDAIAAALEAAQRLAAETDAEDAADDVAEDTANDFTVACKVCSYLNRAGTKFCGMCGVSVAEAEKAALGLAGFPESSPTTAIALPPDAFPEPEMRLPTTRPTGNETHHYHHHYHHHYFPGAPDGAYLRAAEPARDSAREEKLRSTAASLRGDLSRAEAPG